MVLLLWSFGDLLDLIRGRVVLGLGARARVRVTVTVTVRVRVRVKG